ncbi:gamma-glutamyltranspeptidase / glutathione hydrolase / leukotriene-C4 hydrolase [Pancytospora epiphaga]|nr:gamma-glutamyltranspeptidase / glutathione hydrolase / leukotriene-C4 hydrolase [Pancytospora epiphaga]
MRLRIAALLPFLIIHLQRLAKTWKIDGAMNGAFKYKKFAVSSEIALCSQLGTKIMKEGGNAMDASVSTAICIGIINSFSSGIGGGGFMLIYDKNSKKDKFNMFDFRETAPLKIDAGYFKEHNSKAKTGGMAVATPGEVLGMYTAHKKYGKLPWKRLFVENIIIARRFKAGKLLIKKLQANKAEIMADEGLRQIFTRKDRLLKVGEWVYRKNLAKTLKIISEDPISFYKGDLANMLVDAVQKQGGILSLEDMRNYTVKERDVLTTTYRGYDVYTTSLPSGGILIIEALKILEAINFDEIKNMDKHNRLYHFYQLMIETFKFISATRENIGDPDYMNDPEMVLSQLLSTKYTNEILLKIPLDKVLDQSIYSKGCHFCEDHGTTHFNVMDQDGMIVQVTSTINLEFGSKFMDPVTGIIFNNQIDDFYIPNVKNAYNLAPDVANIIEGGKRPLSSAAPVLFLKDGEALALGATGGTRIPTAIIGTLAYLELGMPLDQAISQSRIHNQLFPNVTYTEETFPEDVRKRLEMTGQNMQQSQLNTIFTSVQALYRYQNNKGECSIFAVSDPRKMGSPDGV